MWMMSVARHHGTERRSIQVADETYELVHDFPTVPEALAWLVRNGHTEVAVPLEEGLAIYAVERAGAPGLPWAELTVRRGPFPSELNGDQATDLGLDLKTGPGECPGRPLPFLCQPD